MFLSLLLSLSLNVSCCWSCLLIALTICHKGHESLGQLCSAQKNLKPSPHLVVRLLLELPWRSGEAINSKRWKQKYSSCCVRRRGSRRKLEGDDSSAEVIQLWQKDGGEDNDDDNYDVGGQTEWWVRWWCVFVFVFVKCEIASMIKIFPARMIPQMKLWCSALPIFHQILRRNLCKHTRTNII